MEEIEVKFLNINIPKIVKKLKTLGAKKVFSKFYKRKLFDYPDYRLNKENRWLRLRNEGDKITLTYKKLYLGKKTEEIEVEVNDFKKTSNLLENLGFILKRYVENKRTRYILGDIEFNIDHFPLIKPYLEIESDSWNKIKKAISLLGLNPKDQKIMSPKEVYQTYGIDEDRYSLITFKKQIKKIKRL